MRAHDNSSTIRSRGSLPYPEHTPETFFVRGRKFIHRGSQWIDEAVENMPDARHIRIRFDTPEFFRLLAKRPELVPNIGIARNVQVALGDTIYEIYE